MARAEVTGTTADAERQISLAGVRSAHRSTPVSDMLVEVPAAVLVVAEIVILFAGVVFRYLLHQPADLVG